MPWLHLHIDTKGLVKACCNANITFGDINKNTLEEIWNGDAIKKFRARLMQGVKDKRCNSCYSKESSNKSSMRTETLQKFEHHLDWVKETEPGGTSKLSQPVYFDIRFNNLCNLRCRTCWHGASSSWFEEAKLLKNNFGDKAIISASNDNQDLIRSLFDNGMEMEEIYFAGGEPLMMEDHYYFLKALIEKRNQSVHLRYNTNLSFLKLKSWDVVELWKQFENITLAVSIDGMGARGEYIRKGLKWNVLLENMKIVKEQLPHVKIQIAPTVSVLNVLDLSDLHQFFVNQGLIGVNDIYINMLSRPDFYHIGILPSELKKSAEEHIQIHINWLIDHQASDTVIDEFLAVISFMNKHDLSKHWNAFRQYTQRLDGFRDEKFKTLYPEFNNFLS